MPQEPGWDIYLDAEKETMVNNSENEPVYADLTDEVQGVRRVGGRIAPAVALLLLTDSVYADSEDTRVVSEPSTLGLLAAGAVVGGVVAYIRNKRRK